MAPKKDKGKGKEKAAPAGKPAIGPPPKPKKIPPPPACFKPEDLQRFKELFKSFDEENIDKVPLDAIPTMLRKVGFNPKGAQIQFLFETFLEDELVDTVEYHEFLKMLEAKLNMGDDFEHTVNLAFEALGHDEEKTGFCDLLTLKEELFEWGEPLTEVEFMDWIKVAKKDKTYNPEDGQLSYLKFIENMNNKDLRFIGEPINYFKLDQKTLAEMAMKKAAEEREEQERKEAEKKAREEARRQRMIAEGLIQPD